MQFKSIILCLLVGSSIASNINLSQGDNSLNSQTGDVFEIIDITSPLENNNEPKTKFNVHDPKSYNHKLAKFNNKTYHYVEQGPKSGQTILLLHGFPESWYSWKYQIDYLANKLGYHVIAFDMPGYGLTKVEDKLDNYLFKAVAADIHFIFTKCLKQDKVIVIGHDWGSFVGWELAYQYPKNLLSYISLTIPYFPTVGTPMSEREKAVQNPVFGYQVAINEGDVNEWDKDVKKFLRCFWIINKSMTKDGFNMIPLNETLYEHHAKLDYTGVIYPEDNFMNYLYEQFKIQGTKGATNWYRTSKLNGIVDQQKPHLNVTVKSLQVLGTEDFTTPFKDFAKPLLKDISTEMIPGGHWIHLLNSTLVNPVIGNFLKQFKN